MRKHFFLLGERRHSKYFQEFPLYNVTLVSQANRFYSQSLSQLSRPLDSLRWQVFLQGPSNTLVMDKVSKTTSSFHHKTLHKNLNPSLYSSLLHIKIKLILNSRSNEEQLIVILSASQRNRELRGPFCYTAMFRVKC